MLLIPPELDRALARSVVTHARSGGPHAGPDPTVELQAVVVCIVDVLRSQGARASDVALAFDDAFAALMAGQQQAEQRRTVRVLEERARRAVAVRLGYG